MLFAAVTGLIFSMCDAKLQKCIVDVFFNRICYITFFENSVLQIGNGAAIKAKGFNTFKLILWFVYWPLKEGCPCDLLTYGGWHSFARCLGHSSLLVVSSGTNLWGLKYFKHFWKFDGSKDGSDFREVQEERIVAGEGYVVEIRRKMKALKRLCLHFFNNFNQAFQSSYFSDDCQCKVKIFLF